MTPPQHNFQLANNEFDAMNKANEIARRFMRATMFDHIKVAHGGYMMPGCELCEMVNEYTKLTNRPCPTR